MDVGNILASLASSGPGFNPSTLPPWMQQHIAANIAAQGSGMPSGMAPQAPPANAMQAATAPAAPAPSKPTTEAPQRQRHSLVDTLGRIADTFAALGHAPQNYQAGLDAEDARKQASITHGLERTHAEQEIAQGADEATARHNALVGTAVRGLQAIQRRGGDINTAWPLLAEQAGIPHDQAARLAQIFAAHPEAVDGIAAITAGHQEYNGNVIYARGPDGHIAAFQPSNSNTSDARNILPAGFEPIDPLTFVNTGGAQVGIGQRSGIPQRILPMTEAPGHAADRAERRYESDTGHATTITVAGMPARERAAAAGQNAHATNPTNGLTLLNNIESAFGRLHQMNALPGDDGGVVNNVLGALGRTHLGQAVGEQAGSPAAQTRLEIAKNVSALQQEMLRSLPASATRTRFEQEMLARGLPDPSRMSYGTARTVIGQLRESYTRAVAEARQQQARPAAPARVQPRTGSDNIPTLTPAQAAQQPRGTRFRATDGRILVRQ